MCSTNLDWPLTTVRANQKDAHVEALLKEHVTNVLQKVKGSRFLHKYTTEVSALTAGLYLALTTLAGSRTLGEEYTDLIYVSRDRRLASWKRRAGYVFLTTLGPLGLSRVSPWIRKKTSAFLERAIQRSKPGSLARWLLEQLNSAAEYATLEALLAVNLAFFYFSGAYYQLSKRVIGLRYVCDLALLVFLGPLALEEKKTPANFRHLATV